MEEHPVCSYSCEQICEAWDEGPCNETLCQGTNYFWMVFFTVAIVLLSVRLFQFIKYQPKPRFSLKKLVFMFTIAGFFIRLLELCLRIAEVPAPLWLMQVLWTWSNHAFFAIYSLFLLFWANLIRKGKIPFQWLGKRMKIYFVAVNIVFLTITTGEAFLIGFIDNLYTRTILNLVAIIIVSSFAIVALYEGSSLIRTLRKSDAVVQHDQPLIRKITKLSVGSSAVMMVLVGHVLVIGIAGRLHDFTYTECHIAWIFYNCEWLVGIANVILPMADFRVDRGKETPEKKRSGDKSPTPKRKTNTPPGQTGTTSVDIATDHDPTTNDLTTSTLTLDVSTDGSRKDSAPPQPVEDAEHDQLLPTDLEKQDDSSTPSSNESPAQGGKIQELDVDNGEV